MRVAYSKTSLIRINWLGGGGWWDSSRLSNNLDWWSKR